LIVGCLLDEHALVPLSLVPKFGYGSVIESVTVSRELRKMSNAKPIIPPKRTASQIEFPLNMFFHFMFVMHKMFPGQRITRIPFFTNRVRSLTVFGP